MLSLGLVLAFSASAMAVDVKFSGSFYAAGMYLDKTNFYKAEASNPVYGSEGVSTAFYYQRLRVQTDFIVSPGLKLVTRFDAMERAWGAPRSSAQQVDAATGMPYNKRESDSSGTAAENENIAFDWAYVEWTSPIGLVMAGYMDDGAWGTEFGDSSAPLAKLQFVTKAGPVILAAYAGKTFDGSSTGKLANTKMTDNDTDKYVAFADYQSKSVSAGFLYAFYNIKSYKGFGATYMAPLAAYGFPTGNLVGKAHAVNPYAKAKFGPVEIGAEICYVFGNVSYEDGLNVGKDISLSMLTAYLGAKGDFGPAYAGVQLAYVSGDDPYTSDKWEGGQIGGGFDWNPALIMFNRDRTYWAGSLAGYGSTLPSGANNGADSASGLFGPAGMTNAYFAQGYVGGRPVAALDIRASLSYAQADKKPYYAGVQPVYLNNSYGYELDVTGTYKITNNLSYMLGLGYWFVGDYFKANTTNSLKDDYLLINKLTLTF